MTDKSISPGNTTMLVLKLLETQDMYGYQIIEELSQKSEELFKLKTGTLYPLLHGLENDGNVISYDQNSTDGSKRVRKYYRLTSKGKGLLAKKEQEWQAYTNAVGRVMAGGVVYAY